MGTCVEIRLGLRRRVSRSAVSGGRLDPRGWPRKKVDRGNENARWNGSVPIYFPRGIRSAAAVRALLPLVGEPALRRDAGTDRRTDTGRQTDETASQRTAQRVRRIGGQKQSRHARPLSCCGTTGNRPPRKILQAIQAGRPARLSVEASRVSRPGPGSRCRRRPFLVQAFNIRYLPR